MSSDTPRTDEAEAAWDRDGGGAVQRLFSLARQLERELNALRATESSPDLYARQKFTTEDERSAADRAKAKGQLVIDHGSISLACKPEVIQLFVDRMVAAKLEREAEELRSRLEEDAARYRFARDRSALVWSGSKGCGFRLNFAIGSDALLHIPFNASDPRCLDTAIDAARSSQEGK